MDFDINPVNDRGPLGFAWTVGCTSSTFDLDALFEFEGPPTAEELGKGMLPLSRSATEFLVLASDPETASTIDFLLIIPPSPPESSAKANPSPNARPSPSLASPLP